MSILLAWGRWCTAFVVWLSTCCLLRVGDVEHCRTALDIAWTVGNQQPGAFLAAVDWGCGSRLMDAAVAEQQRSVDSCGPAALRRVVRNVVAPRQGTATAELVRIAQQVDAVLATQGLGCTLGDIGRAAACLGLTGRLFVVHDLNEVRPPAILHLRRGHFVVLESNAPQRVQFFDPAHGVMRAHPSRLALQWSGAVLQLAGATPRQHAGAERP